MFVQYLIEFVLVIVVFVLMLLNNVLLVVVNVHNLNVIFFDNHILYLIHWRHILRNIIANQILNDDHVRRVNEIHFVE